MVSSLRGEEEPPRGDGTWGSTEGQGLVLWEREDKPLRRPEKPRTLGGREGSCPMTLRTRGQWSGTLEVTRKGDKQENKQECDVGLRPPGGHSSRDTAPPGGAEVVATGRDSPLLPRNRSSRQCAPEAQRKYYCETKTEL